MLRRALAGPGTFLFQIPSLGSVDGRCLSGCGCLRLPLSYVTWTSDKRSAENVNYFGETLKMIIEGAM